MRLSFARPRPRARILALAALLAMALGQIATVEAGQATATLLAHHLGVLLGDHDHRHAHRGCGEHHYDVNRQAEGTGDRPGAPAPRRH